MRRRAALAAALGLVLAGCGAEGTGAPGDEGEVIVSAAASLRVAFTEYGAQLEGVRVRQSFAGSDELAAQIRRGVRPDVFAAANTALPEALHRQGLVERPRTFATNELVLAVPANPGPVGGLDDLRAPGISLAVGSEGVPVGAYTREVLDRLGPAPARAVLANVRSEEPDVKGIVGKLVQRAVDAGFVYRSDVRAAGGRLRAITLPDRLRPTVAYGIAVVRGGRSPGAARRFVAGLERGRGAEILRSAGFGLPPRG